MCHNEKRLSQSTHLVTGNTSISLKSPTSSVSANRISPFRRVAKSARINLNRYWGILSQKVAVANNPKTTAAQFDFASDFADEEEQNRQNEMIEAQALAASSQNSLNSLVEEEIFLNQTSNNGNYMKKYNIPSPSNYNYESPQSHHHHQRAPEPKRLYFVRQSLSSTSSSHSHYSSASEEDSSSVFSDVPYFPSNTLINDSFTTYF